MGWFNHHPDWSKDHPVLIRYMQGSYFHIQFPCHDFKTISTSKKIWQLNKLSITHIMLTGFNPHPLVLPGHWQRPSLFSFSSSSDHANSTGSQRKDERSGPFSFPNASVEKKCNYVTRKVTELLSCFSPLNLLSTLYVHWYGIAWGMVVDRQIYHWLTFGLVFQVGIISTDEGFQYAELRERLRLEPGHKYVLVSEIPGLGEFENSPTLEQKT